ncbi:MAG: hypothetical protein Q8R04_07010, partial [Nanoarchaeota archaeon]|nr:hypothetical protein [Nanoarchaeota archaeon]
MKIIYLEIKKVTLGRFFPNEGKLELEIFFNDGTDKEILKVVNMEDAKKAAENVLSELIKMENQINRDEGPKKIIAGNLINIVVKDKDNLIKEIAGLIQQAKIKIDEIKSKNVAEG